ncbi:hypothetical protein FJZ26_04490 [Candidatus Parvarchaeota archaeon]|nr:hypothetical protein [Candidatus Parvarchaeota archaeon]
MIDTIQKSQNKSGINTSLFAGRTYQDVKLKGLKTKLEALNKFFHENKPGGGHDHKTPSSSQLPKMQRLRVEIRDEMKKLLVEKVPTQEIEKLVKKFCKPTIDFLTNGTLR